MGWCGLTFDGVVLQGVAPFELSGLVWTVPLLSFSKIEPPSTRRALASVFSSSA
jgi:hypothetical protein